MCGLDYSGKTTLIKKYATDLDTYASKNKPKEGDKKPEIENKN